VNLVGTVAALVFLLYASGIEAQTPARRLTTIDAVRQFPGYFHLQNLLLRGEFAESDSRVTFRAADQEMRVFLVSGASAMSGPVEIRAQMVDVGRLEPGDPRAQPFTASLNLGDVPDRWPKPGEELVLLVSGVTSAQPATMPTLRALALEPWRFEGQKVTVVGQFRGRNLLGDLPASPAKGRYDFVLRAADGSVWITGLRPRARNVELSVDARVDTGRWVQVTGTVARERGLVMIEGTTFAEASAPEVVPTSEEPSAPAVPLLPVEVVFSSPTPDEVDVSATTSVRVQFSRGLNPSTLAGQIRVSILGAEPGSMPPQFQQTYDAANRAVEIKFTQPLEAFKTIRVEFLEGLKGFDGAPFTAWTLTFSVGG
jgi:Big-like domain-containing protein